MIAARQAGAFAFDIRWISLACHMRKKTRPHRPPPGDRAPARRPAPAPSSASASGTCRHGWARPKQDAEDFVLQRPDLQLQVVFHRLRRRHRGTSPHPLRQLAPRLRQHLLGMRRTELTINIAHHQRIDRDGDNGRSGRQRHGEHRSVTGGYARDRRTTPQRSRQGSKTAAGRKRSPRPRAGLDGKTGVVAWRDSASPPMHANLLQSSNGIGRHAEHRNGIFAVGSDRQRLRLRLFAECNHEHRTSLTRTFGTATASAGGQSGDQAAPQSPGSQT